jgi:hypothetical protein
MPPLRDAEVVDKIRIAFEDRNSDGVRWKLIPAQEWLRKNLEECTVREVNDLIYKHILDGGTIYVAEENREGLRHDRFHYDFHITILGHPIYVETTMQDARMGPVVTVVNIHYAD